MELRSKACTLPRFRVGIARMQDFETQVPPFPAWPSTMSSEGGVEASAIVWRGICGVAVESLHPAKIQNRHRENARRRNASATPNQGTSHCSPR